MKTLLPVIALASAFITAIPAFANDFSSDFVSEKITQHWELDTLEITQRIDVKKRREMEQKSSDASEKKLQAFETALKKLMQQGDTEIDEDTITSMMSGFGQLGQDAQMISMGAIEDTMFPDQSELMLTDMSDYEATMMIEEAFALNTDGSVLYPQAEITQTATQNTDDGTDTNLAGKWSFNEEKQQLSITEQQDDLNITASYKLLELTDKRLVLEGKQPDGSVRMIFSSK